MKNRFKITKRGICAILTFALAASSTVCISGCANSQPEENDEAASAPVTSLPQIDMSKWHYQEDTDVFWQVGISYCENPVSEEHESLAVFVPGEYMKGTANGDDTFTCELYEAGKVGEFSAMNAPIVIPVDTPGYTDMKAPTGYVSEASDYASAGFIYVQAGCRGRDQGAPAGVTDLKAAIRYIRYNESVIPGNMQRIFSFGMSGGGAQSALLGASGDSPLFDPYLQAVGAVQGVSDAVTGSMCWCPVTSLDSADAAYEWNMGSSRENLDSDMQALSDGLAAKYAEYINGLGLVDENGNALTLEESEHGIYQAGSYYDYLKQVIEGSLNNFLSDTTFPYDSTSASKTGGRGGMGRELLDGTDDEKELRGKLDGELPDLSGELPDLKGDLPDLNGAEGTKGELPDLNGEEGAEGTNIEERDGIARNDVSGSVALSGTYDSAQDYIDALNQETTWVNYDSSTNTATITGIEDFVKALKPATKDLGAFDALDESQGENILFGDGDGEGQHFDKMMAELLAGTDNEEAFAQDLQRTDALGTSVEQRVNMYSPLFYITQDEEGQDASEVADYWRIRSGINQGDTALSTEVNLALALENLGKNVDFETVWGQGHVEAERTGDSTTNFIEWVQACCQ